MQGDVIDGYSVQEAASVLGVPEGRVWELLARGVIGGAPEGDSMRVYLKARGETRSPRQQVGESGEASAFRELLTEFRSLTERYGQALLALGEARGEVAGLRARVELLESRVDLRLTGPAAEPIAWSPRAEFDTGRQGARPKQASRASAPRGSRRVGAESRPPTPQPRAGELAQPAAKKPARQRRAVAGIAEALARADDPSRGALPRLDLDAPSPAGPPAPTPEREPAAQIYSTEVIEPDWFADGDFAWLEAADREIVAEAPPMIEEAAPVESAAVEEAPAVAEDLPAMDPPASPGHQPSATLSLTEEELAQLAATEGWGAAEVDTIRSLIGADEPAAIDLPGSAELDLALAALDAPAADVEWSKPHVDLPAPEFATEIEREATDRETEPVNLESAAASPPVEPAPSDLPPIVSDRLGAVRPLSNEPSWLRGRRGPAATAFRTLRRLLPG